METDNKWRFGAQQAADGRPEFIRLPPPGRKCSWTGLSRSALNGLILPSAANAFRPPVRSFVLRKPGARTGIRLIDYSSLAEFIRSNKDVSGLPVEEKSAA